MRRRHRGPGAHAAHDDVPRLQREGRTRAGAVAGSRDVRRGHEARVPAVRIPLRRRRCGRCADTRVLVLAVAAGSCLVARGCREPKSLPTSGSRYSDFTASRARRTCRTTCTCAMATTVLRLISSRLVSSRACLAVRDSCRRFLPRSHTCFQSLELPAYSSAAVLRAKLLLAIQASSEQSTS